MAHAGQVLVNPLSGERFTFLKTARETNGEVLEFELELTPDGHVPGAHVHPMQQESFEVLEGTMKFRKGFRVVTVGPGDTVVVPRGTVHRFENVGGTTARVRVEVRPALRMEELFEAAVSLAREGRTNAAGLPYPLDLALFMREFENEGQAPLIPIGITRAVMAPLATAARRRGLDARYRGTTRPVTTRGDSRRPTARDLVSQPASRPKSWR